MRKIYRILLPALLCVTAQAASAAGYRAMNVNMTDGSQITVNLSDELRVSFTTSEMVITTPGATDEVKVDRSKIAGFTLTDLNSIDAVTDATPGFDGRSLSLSSLPEGSVVNVYDAGGLCVMSLDVAGSAVVDLGCLQTGVYIVSVNGMSYKISVK